MITKQLDMKTISKINSANCFLYRPEDTRPTIRPWQYILMEYQRFGLQPPARIPSFESIEDAQIWLCLDSRYNYCLRESAAIQPEAWSYSA